MNYDTKEICLFLWKTWVLNGTKNPHQLLLYQDVGNVTARIHWVARKGSKRFEETSTSAIKLNIHKSV